MVRFGSFELDQDAFELRRGDEVVPLQPKVFDVLSYLVRNHGRVVNKRELLDELWPGEHVNESAVPWSISHARRAIDQKRGDKGPIETVHGRGYRFVGEVTEVAHSRPPPSLSSPPPPPSPAPSAEPAPGPRVTPWVPPEATTPLVGRDAVMERLRARLQQAREGRGHLVLLAGEAGIGKTRCANELARAAYEQDMVAWSARCVDVVGAPVFWPFIQILRGVAHERPALAPRCQDLLSRMLVLEGEGEGETDDEQRTSGRFWLLDGVSQLVQDAAREAPLLLLLDDLHWADAGSLDLLGFLAPELSSVPLLVVGTLRDELDEGSEPLLRRIVRHAERIPLSRLDVDDVRSYMTAVLGAEPAESLAEAVHRAAAGNPLFLQETVRALIAAHGAEAVGKLKADEVRPPDVARDVLRGRMSSLPESERDLLAIASVLGEDFELSILQALAEAEPDELLSRLEGAVRTGLLAAQAPHRYRFTHDLIRSVLYGDLPTPRKVALHRRAGEALAEVSAGEPRHSEIAFHYHRSLAAGDYARVAMHARRAAQAAARVYGYADAVTYYEWALEAQALDASATPRDRAELLLVCGEAQRRAGRDADARATLARMIETSRQHGYADLLVRSARVLRPTQAMSALPDPMLRSAMEEVLRVLPDEPSPDRVRALAVLSGLPPYAHDPQRTKELSARALDLARQLGEQSHLLEAMRARLYSLSGVDDVDALVSLCEEMLGVDASDSSWISGEAYAALFGAYLLRGDVQRADEALGKLKRVTEGLRWPEIRWYHDRLAAQRVAMSGDFEHAEKLFRELLERSRKIRLSYGETFMRLALGQLALERYGTRQVGQFMEINVEPGQGGLVWASYRAHVVKLAAELGRHEEVERALEDLAARDFAAVPRDIAYLNTLANLAEAAARIAHRGHAERLYALLSPYAGYNTPNGMMVYMGMVDHYLGLLAACLGRDEEAEQHFRVALELEREMGTRPWVARTLYAQARWLCRRPEPDLERGHDVTQACIDEAEALGMEWLSARARKLLPDSASS